MLTLLRMPTRVINGSPSRLFLWPAGGRQETTNRWPKSLRTLGTRLEESLGVIIWPENWYENSYSLVLNSAATETKSNFRGVAMEITSYDLSCNYLLLQSLN